MKTSINVLILTSVVASVLALPQGVRAQRPARPVPPAVPDAIKVEPGYKPFLAAHAVGTQGYVCIAVGSTYGWTPFGPQATLYNEEGEQILTHFLSPTPYSLPPNPTWQHSRDSSIVWGEKIGSSSDSNFVAPGAIPWLLLEAVVVGDGPTGGDRLLPTRFIQRLNTVDGMPPSSGCAAPGNIGQRALVPYEADYFFYKEKARSQTDSD
jgi:hypothetical protein